MTDAELQLMMLDIDGVLSRHGATAVDLLTAAQQMAVSAIGHLVNAASKREQDDARISHAEREQGRAKRLNESSGTGSADSSDATASGNQVPVPCDSTARQSETFNLIKSPRWN